MEETVQDATDCSLTYGDITSPSQLQEVTLDQDITFSNSMGLRSPGGPLRGRSVKEFEEQLTSLKKENFNLKLRIYFLEERMGSNFNLDKENVVKKNVELMVEVESLRKEVQEKHDLLCQAVKAMELEDEEHKKLVTQKEEIINDYQQEIENLKTQLLETKTENSLISPKSCDESDAVVALLSSQAFNVQDSSSAIIKDLQERIVSLEEELTQEKENGVAVQLLLDQTDSRIKELYSKLEEATSALASREEDLQEMSERLEESKEKCRSLQLKLQEKSRLVDQLSEKDEKEALMAELEKERRRAEKAKAGSERRIAELQSKLEAAMAELKKSQELVVASDNESPKRRSGITDVGSFSVQEPATPPGSPQKDTFDPLPVPSPVTSPVSCPSSAFGASDNSLRQMIEQLKTDRDLQHQKIVKLKAEQMKACKIIKTMIDSRNKTKEEIAELKRRNEELEQELGRVKKGAEDGNHRNEVLQFVHHPPQYSNFST